MWRLFLIIGVVLVGGYFLFINNTNVPAQPAAPQPLVIGFIGPLTGDGASLGQNARAGVELAVTEVNAAGGVNGRPLQVIYEDGKCNGKDAANAANKLINVDKVPVILGGACSGETMSFASAAEAAKTVVFSYCSSAPAISDAGDYIFRDYPSDLYQGSFAADYIFNTLKKKTLAVLYVKSDWGSGIKGVFVDAFTKLGGKIVLEEGYEQTSRDLRAQLTKIKAAKPDIVYFLGYTEGSIVGLKQAAELKLKVPMFGGDAWDDPKIFSGAGKAAEGVMYSVVYAPLSDAFKLAMKTKVGSDEIVACTPPAYDAVHLLSQVMTRVGTDASTIKDALYKTTYDGGVSSAHIAFDSRGDLVGAGYVVKVVKDGKAVSMK